jgi:predicted ATPase/transcriptional regulator with XRE-family HTH domain
MPDSALDNCTTFGELLKCLRRRARLTQRELGAAVGYSEAHVARLESGQRLPDVALVKDQFAAALGLPHDSDLAHHLFSLAVASRAGTEPVPAPLPTLHSSRLTNLPAQLTSFVGRKRELAEVKQLIGPGGTRLLTLTGSGGAGKTRLAQQAAADLLGCFEHGAWLVELAPLSDPGLVADLVATALGLPSANHPALAVLADHLQDRHLLLIIDNCEHLVDACAALAEALLRACPRLHILATSREPLNIPGEVTWRVPSLAAPDGVKLFVERARAARPGFNLNVETAPIAARICERLDGMPLAIELAASRLRAFTVDQIAARLDDRFHLLTGGSRTALPRHQTLRAMIDWSYDLLAPDERILLARLSVFAGGWTMEAAEAVCGEHRTHALRTEHRLQITEHRSRSDEHYTEHSPEHLALSTQDVYLVPLLTGLVDKSLVLVDERGTEARYGLLETIRQYAREKLAALGERDVADVCCRHLEYFAGLAQTAGACMPGPQQDLWVARLQTELDNMRAALGWAAQSGDWQRGARLTSGIAMFWFWCGYPAEGVRCIEAVVLSNPAADDVARAMALTNAGWLSISRGDIASAVEWLDQAVTLATSLGNEELLALAMRGLGGITSDYERAKALLAGVIELARLKGNPHEEAIGMSLLGNRMRLAGDVKPAGELLAQSLALGRALGDRSFTADPLWHLGQIACDRGDYDHARAMLEEAAAIYRESGSPGGRCNVLMDLGAVALHQHDCETVMQIVRETIPYYQGTGNLERVGQELALAAGVLQADGQLERAARLLSVTAAIRRDYASHALFDSEVYGDFDRRLPEVRAALDETAFAQAWAEGQQMKLKQAIAEALGV